MTCLFILQIVLHGVLWQIIKNKVTLSHIAQSKHALLVKTKEKSQSKKVAPKNKVALEILHQRLGYRSTRSLMDGDTANVYY